MVTFPLVINPKDKILVVAPHPDDESIGVGGLISMYPNQVDVIVMTDGRYGSDDYSPNELREVRKKEFLCAMDIAKTAHYRMLDYEDGTLINNSKAFENIGLEEYTHIFLPNPNDNHGDHTACYVYITEKLSKVKKDVKVFQYEVHNPLAEVNYHLDISAVIEKKEEMIKCYDSQMRKHHYPDQVKELAKYRGYQNEKPEKSLEVYYCLKNNKENIGVETEKELSKYKQFTRLLSSWILSSKESYLTEYLDKNNYKTIAIYGYGVIGKVLYKSLKDVQCHISYIIDRNNKEKADVPVYHDMAELPDVDIVIITTAFGYEEIKKELKDKCDLLSIYLGDIFLGDELNE